MPRMPHAVFRVLALTLAGVTLPAAAQTAATFPSKAVRMIVPWPPGGGVDLLARSLNIRYGERLGQTVVVDNRGGASGIVGNEILSKAPPDGHTITVDNVSSHATNLSLYPKIPYNSLKDFAPVTMVTTVANMIVVHPSVPARTLPELVRLARARPGQLGFASYGAGGTTHLAGELLKIAAKIDMVHVPYKGGGPAAIDLVGGHVPIYFSVLNTSLQYVQTGKARALAVTGKARSPVLPDVPTVAESGYPGYEANNWYGVLAPAATPADVVAKLAAAMHATLRLPDVVERLQQQGYEIVTGTPAELAAHMRDETQKWAKVIKDAGVRLE